MKVIGISCPLTLGKHVQITSIHFPLSLGVLLAYLRKNGFEIGIWDYNVEQFEEQSFIKRLQDEKPDVIGLAAMTPGIKSAHTLAGLIKKYSPKTTIIIGGPHVDALPLQSAKEFPNFDIIVYGEAEDTFLELCQRLQKKKSLNGCLGIVHRIKGKIVKESPRPLIKNLDKLPYAARDIVNFENYKKAHVERGLSRKFMNIMEFMASRGCPAKCIFCGSGALKPPTLRFRSLQHVLGEIDECVKNYGTNYVNLIDDTFTLNRPFVEGFCRAMKERNLEWGCLTRVDCVTKDMLQMMVDSGCIRVSFGVESGSPRIMALNGKNIPIEKVIQAFKWAHEVGLRVIDGSFIIGSHPDETLDDVKQTIKLIKKIKPTFFSVTVICPLPGTMIYNMMKEEGLIFAEDWEQFAYIARNPSWRTRNFTSEELVKLQSYVMRKTYFTPSYIFRLLTHIRSFNEFRYFLDIGWVAFKQVILNRNQQ
ncbi:MAG TPA: radical SAM protein [Candidatus Nanoarchaeia archaeon]|nr:radical SAM protein [Candidatus Nanoarchaeia archaeon]